MRLFAYISAIILFISCSGQTKDVPQEKELSIGVASTTLKLLIEGNDLLKYINTKLLTDSSRNLIAQLGSYKFSTSIDAMNAEDSRYSPDVYMYYDYEGLQLRYVFKGAGMLQREELQNELENYSKHIYLEQMTIEPQVYKGSLPYGLSKHFGPLSVEKVIGKHNTFFGSGDPNSRISYTYPEKGLFIVFDNSLSDNTIQYITLTDSVTEMKRYPTIYPMYVTNK
jgi:hypothetical protein